MYQENVVLCGASAYEQKYYFNQDFDSLPESIKQELHIMCVLYTEDIGGILTLEFDDAPDRVCRTAYDFFVCNKRRMVLRKLLHQDVQLGIFFAAL